MSFLAYNLLHLIRWFYLLCEDRCRSIEWIIIRLLKADVRIAYHARRWYVHIGNGFSFDTPLPSCARLATLNWYGLGNNLKNSDRNNSVKKYIEKGSEQILEHFNDGWDFSSPTFCFEQGKVD